MLKLIKLWSEEAIQEQLEGCKKNKDVYDKLARLMEEAGYQRSGQQCRDKIKKLKGDYRKVKDHNNITELETAGLQALLAETSLNTTNFASIFIITTPINGVEFDHEMQIDIRARLYLDLV